MQDVRALKNPANLKAWRAWEAEACRRSGFNGIMGGVFALTLAFAIAPGLFARTLGDDLLPFSFVGLILYLATSFALIALAAVRLKAWKRAKPWTPPS